MMRSFEKSDPHIEQGDQIPFVDMIKRAPWYGYLRYSNWQIDKGSEFDLDKELLKLGRVIWHFEKECPSNAVKAVVLLRVMHGLPL